MLFDLHSKGRRRTVRIIYLGLALLMGGGLVLFGVGSGNSGGGLLNGLGGNGSGSPQQQAINQQEQIAQKLVKANPNSASAWKGLVEARYSSAGQAPDYNASTQSFSAAGKQKLTAATQAYAQYLKLMGNKPDVNIASLAARSYAALGNFAAAAVAWETISSSEPTSPHGFECLAINAYAAKQTDKAALAVAKALSLSPPAQRFELQQKLKQAEAQAAAVAPAC